MELNPKENERIVDLVHSLSMSQISETLEDLAKREKQLVETIQDDPEMREITIWNIAVLCAAAGKFSEIIDATLQDSKPEHT
jgi:hypothetical protein